MAYLVVKDYIQIGRLFGIIYFLLLLEVDSYLQSISFFSKKIIYKLIKNKSDLLYAVSLSVI